MYRGCKCEHKLRMLSLLGPQPRFGDDLLRFWSICPQNGTAVLKGICRRVENYRFSANNTLNTKRMPYSGLLLMIGYDANEGTRLRWRPPSRPDFMLSVFYFLDETLSGFPIPINNLTTAACCILVCTRSVHEGDTEKVLLQVNAIIAILKQKVPQFFPTHRHPAHPSYFGVRLFAARRLQILIRNPSYVHSRKRWNRRSEKQNAVRRGAPGPNYSSNCIHRA